MRIDNTTEFEYGYVNNNMQQDTVNKVMTEAALSAGKILKLAFSSNSVAEVSKSNDYYDVVSKADLDSETAIIKILQKKIPEINILSEEKGLINNNSKDTIVVDPLDGSSNFLLGLPHFSIALAHLHLGEVVASVVYNPVLNKMYFAEKGKGVFLNNKKLNAPIMRSLSYVSINFSHKDKWLSKRKIFDKLYKSGLKRVLNNWSPNLDFCMLAEGKISSVISNDSLIFDYAPGYLIAKEAGYLDYPRIGKIDVVINNLGKFVIGSEAKNIAKSLDI